jgi:hypothetical protein
MAKAAKTAIKTKDQKAAAEAKNWTKVIRTVRSPKTGAYTFKEAIVHKDKIKEHWLARGFKKEIIIKKLFCFPEWLSLLCVRHSININLYYVHVKLPCQASYYAGAFYYGNI